MNNDVTLTAEQIERIVAAGYRLIDFTRYLVETYALHDARQREQAALDLHAGSLLDLLQAAIGT